MVFVQIGGCTEFRKQLHANDEAPKHNMTKKKIKQVFLLGTCSSQILFDNTPSKHLLISCTANQQTRGGYRNNRSALFYCFVEVMRKLNPVGWCQWLGNTQKEHDRQASICSWVVLILANQWLPENFARSALVDNVFVIQKKGQW